jgi:hypothetical protein
MFYRAHAPSQAARGRRLHHSCGRSRASKVANGLKQAMSERGSEPEDKRVEFLEGQRVIGSTELFCVINGVLAY